jgi:hypothetical protein
VKLDALRILSIAIIVTLTAFTLILTRENSISDRFVEAQRREDIANIKAEYERKLAVKRTMAGGQPKRSRVDCAESLRAIENKRLEILRENQKSGPALKFNGPVSFLVCEKNLTWLDGSYIPVPLEFEPGQPCQLGEEQRYSMFGRPLEMISELPGPF